ncbi:MAG: flagellar basal body-associated FliL family protein [Proteobacteria bacterium]|nr:flagellar basal body-associated FliL family protein [Pseudomonadota bacterium]
MAEETKKDKEAEKQDSPPKKKPIILWVILGCAVVVIGIGGYFGWTLFMKKGANESSDKTKTPEAAAMNKPAEARIVVPLESFIVNLMDNTGSGKRYLKVTIELEVFSEADKMKLESSKAQMKDTILMLLSSRSFEEINTVEGKIGLKQVLLTQINQMLGGNIVNRIYFTEFVVQ